MRNVHRILTCQGVILLLALLLPNGAAGQDVWKRIKEQTTTKVKQQKQKTDSTLVKAAGKAVDSTVEKTGRTVDTAVSVVGGVVDTALNATERRVDGLVLRNSAAPDPIAVQLANTGGRAVLPEISFVANTDQLAPSATEVIKRLADALRTAAGVFLIEGHTDDSGDAAANQALSEKRAVAVKAQLIAAGIASDRLFAVGYGATRPPLTSTSTSAAPSKARIEVVKMQ